jgi:hypothetical protein
MLVARAPDGSLLLAYVRGMGSVDVTLSGLPGDSVSVSWMDPRTGDRIEVGGRATDGRISFEPPTRADWLLVVEPGTFQSP